MRLGSLFASLLFAAVVFGQPAGWPKEVPLPARLKEYKPTRLGQYLVIRNDRPFHRWHDIGHDDPSVNVRVANPNRLDPWAVSGGMSGLTGYKSVKMTNVVPSQVKTWAENLQVAGTSQLLPGWRWAYPDRTIFADLLVNDAGKPFELRVREKIGGKWSSSIAFEDAAEAPRGYRGAGRCSVCHDKAGASENYGLALRGGDSVFSFNPFDK